MLFCLTLCQIASAQISIKKKEYGAPDTNSYIVTMDDKQECSDIEFWGMSPSGNYSVHMDYYTCRGIRPIVHMPIKDLYFNKSKYRDNEMLSWGFKYLNIDSCTVSFVPLLYRDLQDSMVAIFNNSPVWLSYLKSFKKLYHNDEEGTTIDVPFNVKVIQTVLTQSNILRTAKLMIPKGYTIDRFFLSDLFRQDLIIFGEILVPDVTIFLRVRKE